MESRRCDTIFTSLHQQYIASDTPVFYIHLGLCEEQDEPSAVCSESFCSV